jgi:polysaccharide export outer membrane protein
MNKILSKANLLIRLAGATGCLAFAIVSPVLGADGETGSKTSSSRTAFYVLRPMDLVKVQVFEEPDLDRELRVSQDHTIVMPMIGVVDLKKKTVREAELLIASLYNKDYLVNPQINITVMEYSSRTVNVLGAVNAPGSVVIPPEHTFTLLDAIAKSGGFSRLANRNRLSLTRTLSNGDTQNFTIDADQLVTGDAVNKWTVQDGDIVFVPERLL